MWSSVANHLMRPLGVLRQPHMTIFFFAFSNTVTLGYIVDAPQPSLSLFHFIIEREKNSLNTPTPQWGYMLVQLS